MQRGKDKFERLNLNTVTNSTVKNYVLLLTFSPLFTKKNYAVLFCAHSIQKTPFQIFVAVKSCCFGLICSFSCSFNETKHTDLHGSVNWSHSNTFSARKATNLQDSIAIVTSSQAVWLQYEYSSVLSTQLSTVGHFNFWLSLLLSDSLSETLSWVLG